LFLADQEIRSASAISGSLRTVTEHDEFSSVRRTFFAIPCAFFFWKEVKTNPVNPDQETQVAAPSRHHLNKKTE